MTQRKIKIYKSWYQEYKEFKKNKAITDETIMSMIRTDILKYYGPVTNIDDNRIIVTVRGEVYDFKELERYTKSALFVDMVPQLIYNFMQVHKNDNFRKTGRSISIYFTHAEWEVLKAQAEEKPVSQYIKKVLFNDE